MSSAAPHAFDELGLNGIRGEVVRWPHQDAAGRLEETITWDKIAQRKNKQSSSA